MTACSDCTRCKSQRKLTFSACGRSSVTTGQRCSLFPSENTCIRSLPFYYCFSLCALSLNHWSGRPSTYPLFFLSHWEKKGWPLCAEIWAWIWAREKCRCLPRCLDHCFRVQSNGVRKITFCNCRVLPLVVDLVDLCCTLKVWSMIPKRTWGALYISYDWE